MEPIVALKEPGEQSVNQARDPKLSGDGVLVGIAEDLHVRMLAEGSLNGLLRRIISLPVFERESGRGAEEKLAASR